MKEMKSLFYTIMKKLIPYNYISNINLFFYIEKTTYIYGHLVSNMFSFILNNNVVILLKKSSRQKRSKFQYRSLWRSKADDIYFFFESSVLKHKAKYCDYFKYAQYVNVLHTLIPFSKCSTIAKSVDNRQHYVIRWA